MNIKGLILVFIALGLGAATLFLARGWLETNSTQNVQIVSQEHNTIDILVATKNLPAGHIANSSDFEWQPWPDRNINQNYISRGENNTNGVEGRVIRYGITAGEPITLSKVIGQGDQGFLAAVISPGMRAVSLPIDRASGISGLIFPGDRVDVILTHEIIDALGLPRRASETMLKNVRVLAIDTRTSNQNNEPELGKTVTVETTPKMVEMVAVAQRLGTISLSLRSITQKDENGGVINLQPTIGTASFTWDAEVSAIIENPQSASGKGIVTLSRGNQQTKVETSGGSK